MKLLIEAESPEAMAATAVATGATELSLIKAEDGGESLHFDS